MEEETKQEGGNGEGGGLSSGVGEHFCKTFIFSGQQMVPKFDFER